MQILNLLRRQIQIFNFTISIYIHSLSLKRGNWLLEDTCGIILVVCIMVCINKVIFAVATLIALPAKAFYVETSDGKQHCYLRELIQGSVLKSTYSIELAEKGSSNWHFAHENEATVGIEVIEIFDNEHKVVNQRGSPKGEFTFVALESGEHRFCVKPKIESNSGHLNARLNLNFEQGSEEMIDSKRTRVLQKLHEKVNTLNAKMHEIREEQSLMREREEHSRDVSESVNSRAMWWTIIQIIVLAGTCVWQMNHLSTFFVKQKVL